MTTQKYAAIPLYGSLTCLKIMYSSPFENVNIYPLSLFTRSEHLFNVK